MERLIKKEMTVQYSDPHVPEFPKMRDHQFSLSSLDLTPETIADFDCVLLATDHAGFDYSMIKKYSKLLVDTRGKYLEPAHNIVKA